MKTVIVNGRAKETDAKELGYADVVALAGLPYQEGYTMTYRGKQTVCPVVDNKSESQFVIERSGSLFHNGTINVMDDMVFNVSNTSNA
jgi:hypothetical protein